MKKKIFAIILAVCMLTSIMAISASAANYSDTGSHWASAAIEKWSGYGVLNGNADGTFAPNSDMTRAEAAQVFVNLLKLPEASETATFGDLPEGKWYTAAISACVEDGILNGVGNGNVDPLGTVTREQFFVMFVRALGLTEQEEIEGDFTDTGSVSSWAQGAASTLINKGYVHGVSATSIAPQDEITRASVVSLMNQSIVGYANTDGASIVAEGDGIVLIVADNVTVTATGDVTIVVAAEDATVDLSGVTGEAEVIVNEDGVELKNVPASATVKVADDVESATVNGTTVEAGADYTVPETTTNKTTTNTTTVVGNNNGDVEETTEVTDSTNGGNGNENEVTATGTEGEGEENEVTATDTEGEGEENEVTATNTDGEDEEEEVTPVSEGKDNTDPVEV
jgi:hypothetical protein